METFIRHFNELTLAQLYKILQLRNEVFIVEQNCPYLDIDGKDENALHLFYMKDDAITAYVRILKDDIPAIGRVIVAQTHRNKGLGRKIMIEAIEKINQDYGRTAIKLQAQVYLQNFYQSLGFYPVSKEYLEDNIPHIDMMKAPDEGNF